MLLACAERGTGSETHVFLHGFLGSGRNLASLARRFIELQPQARVLLVDLTGHGTSPPLRPNASLADVASDVIELIREKSPGSPVRILGHSLGGRVALQAAASAPELFSHLVLLDISPEPIPTGSTDLDGVLAALLDAPASAANRQDFRTYFQGRGLTPALTEWLILNLMTDPAGTLTWRIDRQALASFNEKTRILDLWNTASGLTLPRAVIRGGKARFVSNKSLERLAGLGFHTHTFADAGHFVHTDSQEGLLAILQREYYT